MCRKFPCNNSQFLEISRTADAEIVSSFHRPPQKLVLFSRTKRYVSPQGFQQPINDESWVKQFDAILAH